jgi:uncharacterized RDD family membrane protein YckC
MTNLPPPGNYPPPQPGEYPPPGNYPPPPGNYPPPPQGDYPPPGSYGAPPPGSYPPPPGNYPGQPPGGYPAPPPGNYPPPPPGGAGYGPPTAVGNLPQEAYASWGTRALAYVIDFLPIWLVDGIGYAVVGASAAPSCNDGECTSGPPAAFSGIFLLLWVLTLAFQLWNRGYRQGKTGQSIGKSVMKIKMVSEATGQPIGFGMSFVRDLAHIVDGIICYVGFFFPLWDAKRQTIADKIISTVVLPTQ